MRTQGIHCEYLHLVQRWDLIAYTKHSYGVSAHVPRPSPPSLIACSMQIEGKWPGKTSQMNDT